MACWLQAEAELAKAHADRATLQGQLHEAQQAAQSAPACAVELQSQLAAAHSAQMEAQQRAAALEAAAAAAAAAAIATTTAIASDENSVLVDQADHAAASPATNEELAAVQQELQTTRTALQSAESTLLKTQAALTAAQAAASMSDAEVQSLKGQLSAVQVRLEAAESAAFSTAAQQQEALKAAFQRAADAEARVLEAQAQAAAVEVSAAEARGAAVAAESALNALRQEHAAVVADAKVGRLPLIPGQSVVLRSCCGCVGVHLCKPMGAAYKLPFPGWCLARNAQHKHVRDLPAVVLGVQLLSMQHAVIYAVPVLVKSKSTPSQSQRQSAKSSCLLRRPPWMWLPPMHSPICMSVRLHGCRPVRRHDLHRQRFSDS